VQPPEGVYFRRDDYASFWRRVLVDLIDFAVAGLLWLLLFFALWAVFPLQNWPAELIMTAGALTTFGYFVVLKGSRFRTAGYRLGRVALVDLKGQPPSWGTLILRASFAALGPFNWFLDLMWLTDDRHRQALRDKISQTYVVKQGAQPEGNGRLVYRYWEICGYNLLLREVAVEEPVVAQAKANSA
jgi:hypothetical protein